MHAQLFLYRRNENHVRSSLESERKRSSSSIVCPTHRRTATFSVEFIKWMVTIYATTITTMGISRVGKFGEIFATRT